MPGFLTVPGLLVSLNAIAGSEMVFIFGWCDSFILPLLAAFAESDALTQLTGKILVTTRINSFNLTAEILMRARVIGRLRPLNYDRLPGTRAGRRILVLQIDGLVGVTSRFAGLCRGRCDTENQRRDGGRQR